MAQLSALPLERDGNLPTSALWTHLAVGWGWLLGGRGLSAGEAGVSTVVTVAITEAQPEQGTRCSVRPLPPCCCRSMPDSDSPDNGTPLPMGKECCP